MKKQNYYSKIVLLFFTLCSLSVYAQFPKRYDVIVSEIMSKPAPVVGLPEVEYIELHNLAPFKVSLKKWKIKLGNTNKELPEMEIDSLDYVVIIAKKNEELFAPICDNLYSLSSLSITDAGQSIALFDNNDNLIHYVDFKRSWHKETIKQDGGWSLEMIDNTKPFAGKENWDSSHDKSGGTPGKPNSIIGTISYSDILRPIAVTLLDSVTLRVHFSKCISENQEFKDLFFVKPDISISSVTEVGNAYQALDLHFSEALKKSLNYTLEIVDNILDCAENEYHFSEKLTFGVPSAPENGDIVINEILTDPYEISDADYIELFNNSDNIIDLKEIKIGFGGDTLPKKAILAVPCGWQLLPREYILLCKRKEVTMQQFFCKNELVIVECDSMQNLVASEGIVYVTDVSLRPIDRFHYTEKMHYPKLVTTKGVALERLYFERPTQDENNWCSAAETAGFGTPGYENSQKGNAIDELEIEVYPEVFSPDNDGFDDFAEVVCNFNDEENRVNIVIFNNRGALMRCLANNVLCGKSNHFKWDGCDDKGNLLPAGMYVCVIEYWNLQSNKTKQLRKVVSIYQ